MVDQKTILVKIMDPRYPGAIFIDPFEKDCDGFWKNYFV